MNQREDVIRIFQEFSLSFKKKIDKDYYISLQYEIVGSEGVTVIQLKIFDREIELFFNDEITVEDSFVMSYETLRKLYNHELTMASAMSCLSEESGFTRTFIEPKVKDEKKKIYINAKNDNEIKKFSQRMHKMDEFFNKDKMYVAKVDTPFCAKAHGVDAIGLFYNFDKGILHAYFEIKQGEILHEPAISFSIYVLNGKGNIIIKDENFLIESNTYYHYNPTDEIKIVNNNSEVLKLLYLGDRSPLQ
ncbi:MAG: hypothetical protein ACI4FZ_13350 [Lachnospiraceae bacterium]